jgi:hypothetical protein
MTSIRAEVAGMNIQKGDRMIVGKDYKIYRDSSWRRKQQGIHPDEWFDHFVADKNYKKGDIIP